MGKFDFFYIVVDVDCGVEFYKVVFVVSFGDVGVFLMLLVL